MKEEAEEMAENAVDDTESQLETKTDPQHLEEDNEPQEREDDGDEKAVAAEKGKKNSEL